MTIILDYQIFVGLDHPIPAGGKSWDWSNSGKTDKDAAVCSWKAVDQNLSFNISVSNC